MDSVDESLARKFLFSRFIVPVLIVDTCPVIIPHVQITSSGVQSTLSALESI